jgi:hypothetical protein
MRWSRRVPAFAEEVGLSPVAGSDAHHALKVGRALTTFRGRSAADLRAAILAKETGWQGGPYSWSEQVRMFSRQLGKYGAALRDDVGGAVRRDGTGRDLGYPGGRARPPRYDPAALIRPGGGEA